MTRSEALLDALLPALLPTLLAAALLAPLPAAAKACRVDRAHYAALHKGMTYAQVTAHLGCKGRRVSHLAIGDIHRATYSWAGHGTYGANLTLTFRNGRLTDKAQLGLR